MPFSDDMKSECGYVSPDLVQKTAVRDLGSKHLYRSKKLQVVLPRMGNSVRTCQPVDDMGNWLDILVLASHMTLKL